MLGKLTTKSIVAKLKIPKTHGKRAQRAHTPLPLNDFSDYNHFRLNAECVWFPDEWQ